jgi:hypothetical protein
MTFDRNELPLIDKFKQNRNDFMNFKNVLDFFKDANLLKLIPDVNVIEFGQKFGEKNQMYQNIIVELDLKPIPFKVFYELWIRRSQDVCKQNFKSLWNSDIDGLLNDDLCSNVVSSEDVISALSSFDIQQPFASWTKKKLEKKEQKYHTFQSREILEGKFEPRPVKWSTHHIIPSNVLVKFYDAYFSLIKFKSDKFDSQKTYNWLKILEFNTQKIFLVETLQIFGSATLPSDKTRQALLKTEEGDQSTN